MPGSARADEPAKADVRQMANELITAGLTERGRPRFLLGITGPPAAGKSRFASLLALTINQLVGWPAAIAVPMDGFHLPNAVLEARGLRALKGAPQTFDGPGFISLLERLRRDLPEPVWCPIYDRTLHEPVEHALEVPAATRIIIVEGNYLLLDTPPWNQARAHFDQIWYLDAPTSITTLRLLERHITGGRSEQEAREKIAGTDLPNARLIEQTRARADRVLQVSPEAGNTSDENESHPESETRHGKDPLV
ncbi:MAG TPA: nucleoside/nucleotide kinase family protein [Ktedonobacterales bacterium]